MCQTRSFLSRSLRKWHPMTVKRGIAATAAGSPTEGDGTAVRLSAPGAVLHDVPHQVVHVVLQIPDDVLDDVSNRDHAHDLARIQHWQMAKTARSHHCHAALQRIVRLDRHRLARHHLAHRRQLRIEPGQQHFDGAVTLGHDTDQHIVVDYQHRPDPVVAHPEQGFDDHVTGTNMDQGATLMGQSAFYCAHRSPLVGAALPRLAGPHERLVKISCLVSTAPMLPPLRPRTDRFAAFKFIISPRRIPPIMSAKGQKRTLSVWPAMSAKCDKQKFCVLTDLALELSLA